MTEAPISALRKFVKNREPEERCDTCGSPLLKHHAHTFQPATRRIKCACEACAAQQLELLIPSRVVALPHFRLRDAQWEELMIPISLAFFAYSTPAGRWLALYPGPAGAAESLLPVDSWREVMAVNPELCGLRPDVEALLVNRIGANREYFLVPIDVCYQLVGVIRLHWRGLSGGALVWGEISRFFNDLRLRGTVCPS